MTKNKSISGQIEGQAMGVKIDSHQLAVYAAEQVMSSYTFKTLRDTEEVFVYDPKRGVYLPNGETAIKEGVQRLLKEAGFIEYATKYLVGEVIGHIQRETYIDRNEMNADSRRINVKNGILNLVKALKGDPDALEPHTDEFLSTIQLPVVYNPDATCPKIDQFFHQIVAEDDVLLLEEILGWCLLRDYRFQNAFLLLGEGANGKSTFINLVKALLSKENCSAASLQAVCKNRFAVASLYGKLANLCSDLPSISIDDTGMFKMLTGGDPIPAEHKFGTPFTFMNYAKLIFSANRPPQIYEDTLAIWRRFMVIEFPNQFVGDKEVKGLITKLTTEDELSGLLNTAITGLRRLLTQKEFSYHRTWEETRDYYTLISNPLRAFVEECCILDAPLLTSGEPPAISKETLYQSYLMFCQINKVAAESKKGFGRHLKALYNNQIGERKAGWTGIALKE